jgi:hypothetical protein
VTNYLISCELHKPNECQETALLAALEIFEDRLQALDSVWLVCSPWCADQIRVQLSRCLGPDDSLVIEPLPVNRGWSGWMGADVREWMAKHLGPES